METLYLFYFIIILAGIVFNSIHNHSIPQLFSFRTASAFLLSFGLSGMLCIWAGNGIVSQVTLGILAGVLTAGIGYLIMRYIHQKTVTKQEVVPKPELEVGEFLPIGSAMAKNVKEEKPKIKRTPKK